MEICHCHFSPAEHSKSEYLNSACTHTWAQTYPQCSVCSHYSQEAHDCPESYVYYSYQFGWGTEWQSHSSCCTSLPGTLDPCCSDFAAWHSFTALAAFLRWVGSWLCCTHACFSHQSHCRARSPTQPQGNCKAQDGINRSIWRKVCKYILAYLRKTATAFTASTATSSTGQLTVSIKTSMASIHTLRLVNNVISTGCLWRGNKVSKKNVVRVR